MKGFLLPAAVGLLSLFVVSIVLTVFVVEAPGKDEALDIHRAIVAVHEKRLAEYEDLQRRKLASSGDVALVQIDLLNARLALAHERRR